MAKKIIDTKGGPMVQWTVYIPVPIHEKFQQRAKQEFKNPAEAARDAFREYAEKKVGAEYERSRRNRNPM